jgi:GNAT superfamily N-acetyltransferase
MTNSAASDIVEVVPYRDEYREDFGRLNREWIEEFFHLEPADQKVFADPRGEIIAAGGEIFFVLVNGEAQGTCAVLRRDAATYELAKMAVAPAARGKGYGDLLMRAAIEFAIGAGAEELILSSNTRLAPALRLYEKYGFHIMPHVADNRYQRVDIMMRLALPKTRAEESRGESDF